jgi:hypothetical protein
VERGIDDWRVFRNSKATPQPISGDQNGEFQSPLSGKIGCFQKLPMGRKSAWEQDF